jgi:hypothetical protein
MIVREMTRMNADWDHERHQTLRNYEHRRKYDFVVARNVIRPGPNFVNICHIIPKNNGGLSDCMAMSYTFFIWSRIVIMLKM